MRLVCREDRTLFAYTRGQGSTKIIVERLISRYVGQKGVSTVIEDVLSVLGPELLQLLALPWGFECAH